MYSSYTAASFARKHDLAERHGLNLEGALTWAFEFEDQPYFAGFRALASNGIDLPVLNVFRMFAMMRGRRVAVESSAQVRLDSIIRDGVRAAPDVGSMAALQEKRLSILVWHYHDDDVAGPDASVDLAIAGLPARLTRAKLTHYSIDEKHSNAYAAWKSMGSPAAPTREQYTQLEEAGRLTAMEAPGTIPVDSGAASLKFSLPRQAVSLLVMEWE
jgi:xylan 1,4-beta-xylosidase